MTSEDLFIYSITIHLSSVVKSLLKSFAHLKIYIFTSDFIFIST